MENLTHEFRERWTSSASARIRMQIKSKTVINCSSQKKKEYIFVMFTLSEGNFLNICVLPQMYSVLHKLLEYIYFYISKNITSNTFVACS